MALAQCIGLIVIFPHPVAILVKTVQECIPDRLEGTDKIWANRGSMDLRIHGVTPEDTLLHVQLDADHTRTSSDKCLYRFQCCHVM